MTLSLLEAMNQVPDPRQSKNRNVVHPLGAMLTLVVTAMLCGCTSQNAVAQWGRAQGPEVVRLLGFRRLLTPCAAELSIVLRHVNPKALDSALRQWLEERFGPAASPAKPTDLPAVSLDGKAHRAAQHPRLLPGFSTVSAYQHREGNVLGTQAFSKGQELEAVRYVLAEVPLQGQVVMTDALSTHADVAEQIVEKKSGLSAPSQGQPAPFAQSHRAALYRGVSSRAPREYAGKQGPRPYRRAHPDRYLRRDDWVSPCKAALPGASKAHRDARRRSGQGDRRAGALYHQSQHISGDSASATNAGAAALGH
jgi:DDE_Tnp_1-associated